MSSRSLLLAAVLVTTAGAVPAQGRSLDTIVLDNGSRLRGVQVTEMTHTAVKYKKGSAEEQVAAAKVVDVQWADPPDAFATAQAEEAKGEWDAAANHYLEAAEKAERPQVKEDAKFRGARAAVTDAGGDAAKATAAAARLQAYIDEAPQGFHVPEAKLLLGRAMRLAGKPDQATAILTQLEEESVAQGWGIVWDARAKFERARALIDQGKSADARSAYQRVVTAVDAALSSVGGSQELAELKTQSLIGQGETYIAEKDFDQGLSFFRRYTGAPAPGESTELQAAALAGEGEALFSKAPTDPNGLRQAQMALARSYVLDAGSGATSAKALYYSGKVLLALAAIDSNKEKDAKSRAQSYFDAVVQSYPRTRWAPRAREEIGK